MTKRYSRRRLNEKLVLDLIVKSLTAENNLTIKYDDSILYGLHKVDESIKYRYNQKYH